MPQIVFFGFCEKNLSLVIPGNNVKWKIILLFYISALIWWNSGSQVMGQSALGHLGFSHM